MFPRYLLVLLLSIFSFTAFSQNYRLFINIVDKDTTFNPASLGLKTIFPSRELASKYIFDLPSFLAAKGYSTASVDSIYLQGESTHIDLFLGRKYAWDKINTDKVDPKILEASGWNKKQLRGNRQDFSAIQSSKQGIINYYSRNGYPFAEVSLDSIRTNDNKITGQLKVNKGVLYHIDSIRVYGKFKIKNNFLQHYLSLPDGSVYNSDHLQAISKRLLELPYVQEQQRWNLTMLGTGATVNLYLQPKRSNQVDVLIGFAPATTTEGKTQLTGTVNLNLKNALGNGETILLNWQQLQKQSPKLNMGYQHPYIFNSPLGLDLQFNLFKQDSAYVQLNGRIGAEYLLRANQSLNVFYQSQRTFLLSGGYDTTAIKITKLLPQNIDISSNNLGVDYNYTTTDYKYNPRKGSQLSVFAAAGLKNIIKNSEIINLKDPNDSAFNFASLYDSLNSRSYQFNIRVSASHYFPSGKRSAWKLALNSGIFHSPFIFKNELFRIGGYRLLRGFDEESIYADKYAVVTTEFHYLTGLNSYLYLFNDIGFTSTQFQSVSFSNNFISAGFGLSFETKAGLLNVSYAIGNRNDVPFNFKEASKIHFGYINYF